MPRLASSSFLLLLLLAAASSAHATAPIKVSLKRSQPQTALTAGGAPSRPATTPMWRRAIDAFARAISGDAASAAALRVGGVADRVGDAEHTIPLLNYLDAQVRKRTPRADDTAMHATRAYPMQ